MSGAPISPSPAMSLPTTRPCSRRAYRKRRMPGFRSWPTGPSTRVYGDKKADRENCRKTAGRPARWLRCTSGRCRTVSLRFSDGEMRKPDRRSRRKTCWRPVSFSIFEGWGWRAELRPLLHFDIHMAAYMRQPEDRRVGQGSSPRAIFFAVGKRQSRPRKCHPGRAQALSWIVTN